MWNTLICCILLVVILILCVSLNLLNIFALAKKATNSANNTILFISSQMYLISYIILLPLTLAGVLDPTRVISENYCYVQESITLGVVLMGFFLPSLNSFSRMMVVQTGHRNWCKQRHIIGIVSGFILAVISAVLIPMFTITGEGETIHIHGCHLWSTRIDSAMWIRVYTILVGLLLSVTIMVMSYGQIYRRVMSSVHSISRHSNYHGPMLPPQANQIETISAVAPSSEVNPGPVYSDRHTEKNERQKGKDLFVSLNVNLQFQMVAIVRH